LGISQESIKTDDMFKRSRVVLWYEEEKGGLGLASPIAHIGSFFFDARPPVPTEIYHGPGTFCPEKGRNFSALGSLLCLEGASFVV
jgi:hypothetical protein